MYVRGKIEKLRRRLHQAIERHGLDSKEVRLISAELDKLINEYNKNQQVYEPNNKMKKAYDNSIKKIKQIVKEFGDFPNVEEWNHYAKDNNLLSSESLKYISHLNWNEFREKILYEINKKNF